MTSSPPGPETGDEVEAMVTEALREHRASVDPLWQARYGKNFEKQVAQLFGVRQ